MNFFGHAVTAAAHDDSPRFVLGAMLPDLASMARVRLGPMVDGDLRRGVRFHHATDAIFHRNPTFTAACNGAVADLGAAGLQRGPARAVAHVGYELLLDGAISGDRRGGIAYRAAIAAGRGYHVDHDPDGSWAAIRAVLARLAAAPVPQAYDDAAFVAARLRDILGQRPRLSLGANDFEPVVRWCGLAQSPIRRQAASLTAELAQSTAEAFSRG